MDLKNVFINVLNNLNGIKNASSLAIRMQYIIKFVSEVEMGKFNEKRTHSIILMAVLLLSVYSII